VSDNLGACWFSQSEFGRARECFERAVALDAGDARAHMFLGRLAASRGDATARQYKLALARANDEPLAPLYWGCSCSSTGGSTKPSRPSSCACRSRPTRQGAHNLGLILQRQGDKAAAECTSALPRTQRRAARRRAQTGAADAPAARRTTTRERSLRLRRRRVAQAVEVAPELRCCTRPWSAFIDCRVARTTRRARRSDSKCSPPRRRASESRERVARGLGLAALVRGTERMSRRHAGSKPGRQGGGELRARLPRRHGREWDRLRAPQRRDTAARAARSDGRRRRGDRLRRRRQTGSLLRRFRRRAAEERRAGSGAQIVSAAISAACASRT
jgi:hypothetical protein